MKILISGGSRNGKTALALDVTEKLSPSGGRYYVAAMIPCDGEDRARIDKHIDERRGRGFTTLEIGRDIASCLAEKNAAYLIDSVTALLTNEMFAPDGTVDKEAGERCISGLLTVARGARDAVFVTDDIFSDAGRYDGVTEDFRRSLADISRALARECDTVIEMCAGRLIFHKGGLPE